MEGWISRQEEDNFPSFDSHEKALKYLKERYGDNFVLVDIIDVEIGYKSTIYMYNYIVNEAVYYYHKENIYKDFEKGIISPVSMDYVNSYQPIEISKDGHIHCIH